MRCHDTGFFVPAQKQSRLSKVYARTENGLTLYTGDHLAIQNKMATLPAFQSGGAGLVSTLKDYANFGTMLLNGGNFKGHQILEPEICTLFHAGNTAALAAGVTVSRLGWS